MAEDDDVATGYTISLTFDDANPVFANAVVEKRVGWVDGARRLEATELAWRPGREPDALMGGGGGAAGPEGAAAADDGGGSSRRGSGAKRPRDGGDDGGSLREVPEDAVPILVLTLLDEGDDDDEDERMATAAHEADTVCEAIKEEVWADPLKYYRMYAERSLADEA